MSTTNLQEMHKARIPTKSHHLTKKPKSGRSCRNQYTYTRFCMVQVFGVEEHVKKIGLEGYVLKKETKDLPLHPIPLAQKWDNL